MSFHIRYGTTQVDQNTSTQAMENMDSREIRAASIAAKDVGGSYMCQALFKRIQWLFSKWLHLAL